MTSLRMANKRDYRLATAFLVAVWWFAMVGLAQAATVSLSWTAPITLSNGGPFSPGATLTYNVYRGTKPDCSDCIKINAAPVTATAYTDSNSIGKAYYAVTAVLSPGGLESAKSNVVGTDLTALPPNAPSGLRYIIVIP